MIYTENKFALQTYIKIWRSTVKNFEYPQRIYQVTRYYDHLQGLCLVPFGVLLLLVAVWKAGWWPWFDKWQPLSGMLFLGLTMLLVWRIRLYYRYTFGHVHQLPGSRRNGNILAILFLGGLYLIGLAEYQWQWPVSGTGLFTAVVLVIYYFQTGSFRPHYLVLAALMLIVSLLPLFGVLQAAQVYLWGPDGAIGVALFGFIWLVGGLVDHGFLSRTLPRTGESAE